MIIEVDVQSASQHNDLPTKILLTKWTNTAVLLAITDSFSPIIPMLADCEIVEVTIRMVDESESSQLNEKWRQKIGATNVLSFPFEQPTEIKVPLLGDIIICAPLVTSEAQAQNKLLEAHWGHLVVHGTLHLLGYDHILEHQAQMMEALEIQILNQLGYPNPYSI